MDVGLKETSPRLDSPGESYFKAGRHKMHRRKSPFGTAGACSQVWLLMSMLETLPSIKAGLLLLDGGIFSFPLKTKGF